MKARKLSDFISPLPSEPLNLPTPDPLETLRKLADTAETINNMQHAGIVIDGELWSLLYQRTSTARAIIAKDTRVIATLQKIAEDERGIEEPGKENGRFPAWEFGEWARKALKNEETP